jgi:hypothetical protein
MNCPDLPAPDWDLGGSGPNLLEDLVVFGQKSGFLWAFDPEDGNLRWSGAVGLRRHIWRHRMYGDRRQTHLCGHLEQLPCSNEVDR